MVRHQVVDGSRSAKDGRGFPLMYRDDLKQICTTLAINSTDLISSDTTVDCSHVDELLIVIKAVTGAGTPTSVQVVSQFQFVGSTTLGQSWATYREGIWAYLSFAKAETDDDGVLDIYVLKAVGDTMRLGFIGTGTSGLATFIINAWVQPIKR